MPLRPETRHERQAKALVAQALLGEVRKGAPSRGPIRMAEVGVKRGQCAGRLLMLEPRLLLWLIDRWAPAGPLDPYRLSGDPAACAAPEECETWHAEMLKRTAPFWRRTVVLAMESREAAASVADGFFEAVYLDADHSFEARLEDLQRWTRKVRPGGLVAGGLWTSRFGGDGCARAVQRFLELRAWPEKVEVVLGPEKTWWFRRPKNE